MGDATGPDCSKLNSAETGAGMDGAETGASINDARTGTGIDGTRTIDDNRLERDGR